MPESVCTIGVGFLTNSQVSHEIYPLTGIVREIGADYLSVRP